jgi:hypothetical protein
MRTMVPKLTAEERVLGYLTWRLVGDWEAWVKRRVESITYETATSIRRQVSVDLRLHADLFDGPLVRWGAQSMHYVPLAQLRKGRLVRFDLRDEAGTSLPLITKRKNAAIAAAMLTAISQGLLAGALNGAAGPLEVTDPSTIVIPHWLEQDYWRLAYWEPQPSRDNEGSFSVIGQFISAGQAELPIEGWDWQYSDGEVRADVPPETWRALLGSDPGFVAFAYDVARLYLIYAPLVYEPNGRRVVKYSYSEFLGDAQFGSGERFKRFAARHGFARGWNDAEDWLEGLPRTDDERPDEWIPPLQAGRSRTVSAKRRVFEALGWTTRVGKFETPAVGHGASYHLDISTPSGIQIRRAQLVTLDANRDVRRLAPQRGNRTLRAIDLYTSGKEQTGGNAFLNMRPESSLITRAATLSSVLVAAALTLLWVFAGRVTGDHKKHVEAVAAVLVVIPGLLTLLSTRDDEHPLATSMVFGLRVLAIVPGILAFLAAGEVLFGKPGNWFGVLLFALAWLVTAILAVSWRLSARGRPHPESLAEPTGSRTLVS